MKLGELYDRAVEVGLKHDPRGREALERRLAMLRQRYDALPEDERADFDTERLANPFADVRIVVGDRDSEFDTVLTGIQVEPPEILLAGQLQQQGKRVVIIAHHTSQFAGRALTSADDVVWPLVDRLEAVGVSTSKAERLVWGFIRQKEQELVGRSANASTLQIAEGVGVPLISIHTPCDLCHQAETIATVTSSDTVGEAVARIARIPEFAFSDKLGVPVEVAAGDADAAVGLAFFSQACGWRPPLSMMQAAIDAGADTLVVTQAPKEYVDQAAVNGVNLISIPHDMADVRGMRLLYDAVFEGEGIEIVGVSNYRHLDYASMVM